MESFKFSVGKICFFILFSGFVLSFLSCGSQKEAKNLIPNPSFEQDITDKSGNWKKTGGEEKQF